jgi:hypothetical protein
MMPLFLWMHQTIRLSSQKNQQSKDHQQMAAFPPVWLTVAAYLHHEEECSCFRVVFSFQICQVPRPTKR